MNTFKHRDKPIFIPGALYRIYKNTEKEGEHILYHIGMCTTGSICPDCTCGGKVLVFAFGNCCMSKPTGESSKWTFEKC